MHAVHTPAALAGLLLSGASVLSLPATSAFAQVVPDAGRVLQEMQADTLRTAPQPPALPALIPDPVVDAVTPGHEPAGPSVRISGFTLEGNHAIGTATLLALLADAIGTEQSLAGLRALAQRLTDHYHRAGYPLARAYLPAQRVDGGPVRISVLEGRLGAVTIENHSLVRNSALAAPLDRLRVGDAVRADDLDRTLLLINELAGAQFDNTLRPGAEPGATDLVVRATPLPRWVGGAEADNHGGRYTGRYRLGGWLQANSPLGLGDALHLRLLGTNGRQYYGRLHYQVPLGPWSTRLGVAYSHLRYELGDTFKALDAYGTARTSSLYVSQPLWRSRQASLDAQAQYEHRQLRDHIDQISQDRGKRIDAWMLSLSGWLRDTALGPDALTWFTLQHTRGHLRLGDSLHRLEDAWSARTRGSYHKTALWLGRDQSLAPNWRLRLTGQAQWASRNLDSSEKFSLGGPYAVRAYPLGEASGDEGWLASAELRYTFAPGWQASVFYDHGRVRLQRNPWAAGSNHRQLSGAGMGLNWRGNGWQVNATVAWPTGGEHSRVDGQRKPRAWVQVGKTF